VSHREVGCFYREAEFHRRVAALCRQEVGSFRQAIASSRQAVASSRQEDGWLPPEAALSHQEVGSQPFLVRKGLLLRRAPPSR